MKPEDKYHVRGKELFCPKATEWESDGSVVINEQAYQKGVRAGCDRFHVNIYEPGETRGTSGKFLCERTFEMAVISNIPPNPNKFKEMGRKIPLSTPDFIPPQQSASEKVLASLEKITKSMPNGRDQLRFIMELQQGLLDMAKKLVK
jgi:hypothetical protein